MRFPIREPTLYSRRKAWPPRASLCWVASSFLLPTHPPILLSIPPPATSLPERLLLPQAVAIKQRGCKTKGQIRDVFCGSYSTIAITQEGHVIGFGLSNYYQLGELATCVLPSRLRRSQVDLVGAGAVFRGSSKTCQIRGREGGVGLVAPLLPREKGAAPSTWIAPQRKNMQQPFPQSMSSMADAVMAGAPWVGNWVTSTQLVEVNGALSCVP